MNGRRAREIPDDDTSSFLENALGVLGNVPEMSAVEIAKLRGEKIPSITKWKRPLTPEEHVENELRRRVQRALHITKSCFDGSADPQTIIVHFTNRGDRPLYIERVRFQGTNLGAQSLLDSYSMDGVHAVIPFDESNSNMAPGAHLTVELHLAQKWQPSDIERIKGDWGFLILHVRYESTQIQALFHV